MSTPSPITPPRFILEARHPENPTYIMGSDGFWRHWSIISESGRMYFPSKKDALDFAATRDVPTRILIAVEV